MHKLHFILLFFFFWIFNLIHAHDEIRESKFNIIGQTQFGIGNIVSENELNYIINSYGGEFLLSHKLDENDGSAPGIDIYNLSCNNFNSRGNFHHERSLSKTKLVTK